MKRSEFLKSIGLSSCGLFYENDISIFDKYNYDEEIVNCREFTAYIIRQKEKDPEQSKKIIKFIIEEEKDYFIKNKLRLIKDFQIDFEEITDNAVKRICSNCNSKILKCDRYSLEKCFYVHSNCIPVTKNKDKNIEEINKRVDFITFILKNKNIENFKIEVKGSIDDNIVFSCFAY